jgi:hypothetical protein
MLVALALVSLATLSAVPSPDSLDPHVSSLPKADDPDQDFLTTGEELTLGLDPAAFDQNTNLIADGVDLARATVREIAALRAKLTWNEVYRLDFALRGLERCEICGTNVNMGHLLVCNPLDQLYARLPFIALHYLEHDSFSFVGDVHGQGRTDVNRLMNALHSAASSHVVPIADDADADGLKDTEEACLGTRPDGPDTDGDGLGDGLALAGRLCPRITALPAGPQHGSTHVTHHEANCFAPCPVCGQNINCGFLEITHPWAGLSLQASYLNLHFLAQGSFAASASERIDPVRLEMILRPPVTIVAGESQVTLHCMTRAGYRYQLFTAANLSGPWKAGPVFQGDGMDLVFSEAKPAGSPCKFYKIVASAKR